MSKNDPYIPFSQRAGHSPIPPQLKLGQVSRELRLRLEYYTKLEFDKFVATGYTQGVFRENLRRVATDFHVLFQEKSIKSFSVNPQAFYSSVFGIFEKGQFWQVFDLVEFLVRRNDLSSGIKSNLTNAFSETRAAYRIIDNQVVAIGTEEQGDAFLNAIASAEASEENAAKRHLVEAGVALRNSDWAGSVRESINAVETVAIRLAPDAKTLGPALATLEKQGHLHGSLKSAFGKLYGYSSDEEGVRHALVFKEEAQVDETDALFMLGACASFVTYLLSRCT